MSWIKRRIQTIRAHINTTIAAIIIILILVALDFVYGLFPISIAAGFASILALTFYVRESLRIEPVIIQTNLIPVGVLNKEATTGKPATIYYCIEVEL